MATAKTLIDAAYARSTFNDPDKIATDSELIGVIDRRLKQIYSIAARQNPTYFGTTSTVTPASNVWARPTDAELVFRLEGGGSTGTGADSNVTAGDEIHIVPLEDKEAEMPPRVYEFGRDYYSVGGNSDPAATTNGDQIKFYYSKRHPDLDSSLPPDNAANTLDSSWPEQFNDLVVLHVARYLATKDGRTEEISVLSAEEAALMDVFFKHLAHENYGMKSRWGQRARLISQRPTGFGGE